MVMVFMERINISALLKFTHIFPTFILPLSNQFYPMHPIAKILTFRYLRYPKYFLYGMVIVWNFNYLVRTDREMQEKIAYYSQLNRDAIPEKPSAEMAIPGYAWLFKPSGDTLHDTLGNIRHAMLYAYSDQGPDGLVDGRIYFWIWAESVSDNRLLRTETIRDRANAYPLGELKEGTVIESHYINEKKSWILGSCEVTACRDDLKTVNQRINSRRMFTPKIHITSTNQLAGIAVLPRTHLFREEELKTSLRVNLYIILHVLALSFIFFLVNARYRHQGRLRKRLLVRSGLITAGFLIALILNIIIP